MRKSALLLLALTACGPIQLQGNWSMWISSSGTCLGTLALTQTGDSLRGNVACNWASTGAAGVEGSVDGVITGDSVSMNWVSPGFRPALITATVDDERHLAGSANGSGFVNAQFHASRL